MTTIYRAVVRGHFDGLDAGTKARLIAESEQHDFLLAKFTAEGTFTYDTRLVAFNLRYEIRFIRDPHAPGAGADDAAAERHAMERAIRWLDQAGFGYKHLRVELTDMTAMWQN